MKVALIGYGKMGKEIERVLLDSNLSDEIVLKISENNLSDLTVENLQKADVAIEFTQPEAAVKNIRLCFKAGIPVVVGTTAWLEKLPEITQDCNAANGALFHAPNFSIGVNIFFEINRKLAAIMQQQPQYDIGIEEIHHTEKKDAPSGTAIKTAEVILSELKRVKKWQLENTLEVQNNLLPIVAKREPNVPGTHTVIYKSAVDEIVLTHQAHSRKGFAEGAVTAARWLIGKKGVFEMKDLLSF
ncbi:MAG: 4-hydroxy-tetrahydrodipicolinate reductase [Chitinophagales bacterium]|nr:4-hydroxy-tetrahydrodipicolinate reductase [Chitinophagales bacterium]HRN93741.1 4-hydroxy-tetrahydrodipicolinate reductase [Chitinophagales bacterium]